MKRISLLRTSLILPTLFSFGVLACSSPTTRDETQKALDDLDLQIPALMKMASVPGLTLAVIQHGELVGSRAYGLASLEPERATTERTVFEAASIGKVVLGLITLQLADQEVIDLDEHLAETFEYPLLDHDERYARLTPRLILQHSAGLPNWGGWALDPNRDPVEFIGAPGEGFSYSGEGYVALQRFVEFRTGRTLEDLFDDLAAQIGMTDSSFISHVEDTEHYARARGDGGTEREILGFDRPIASFSLISTAEDLARFTAYYFEGGGLSEELFEESLRSVNPTPEDAWGFSIPDGARISWTLAWAVQETDDQQIYLHAGNNGEFRSFLAYSPERDVAVALMANGTGGLSFLSRVLEPLVGDLTPAAVWWGYEPEAGSASDPRER